MKAPSDLDDPKQVVERGYGQVAAEYGRLEAGGGTAIPYLWILGRKSA